MSRLEALLWLALLALFTGVAAYAFANPESDLATTLLTLHLLFADDIKVTP